jgi:hypothetical protein
MSRVTVLGHKSGSFGQESENLGQWPIAPLGKRLRRQLSVESVQIADAVSKL